MIDSIAGGLGVKSGLTSGLLKQDRQLAEDISAECMQISVLTDLASVLAYGERWNELAAKSSGVDFFQSWEWCREYMVHRQQEGGFKPYVVVVEQKGKAIAILPLSISSHYGQKILTGFTEPFQQYTELLIEPGLDPQLIIKKMMSTLRKSGNDLVHLGQVRDGSNLFSAISTLSAPSGEVDAAPFVPLSDWDNFEAYFKTVKSKTRKNMRNARNKLEKEGLVTHQVHFSGDEFADVVKRTFAMRQEWLQQSGMTSRAFRQEDFEAFIDHFAELGRSGKSDVRLVAMSYMLDDHPIAEQWGFIHKNRYYAFISGWDIKYEVSSPGKLHLGEVIKACYDEGLDCVDMMIPNVAYKQTWARGAVEVKDFVLPLSPSGYLFNITWLNFLRPVAKKVFYKLPVSWRARILSAYA